MKEIYIRRKERSVLFDAESVIKNQAGGCGKQYAAARAHSFKPGSMN